MAIDQITIHHMAGQPSTLKYIFGRADRNGSTHFGVFPTKFEQYVKIGDTAWGNGNWKSNSRSISIENWGDWRFGWTNAAVLVNLKKLLRELRIMYPGARLTFHKYESDKFTECPAELENYAKKIWAELTTELSAPTPPPATNIKYDNIKDKKVVLNKSAVLWDFAFNNWSDAKAIKGYQKGHVIDVVAQATNSLGGKYYMTAYSYNGGNIRYTHGFNVVDCDDFTEPVPPEPPVDPPVEPPIDPPVDPPVEPPVEPEYPNWFVAFWIQLWDAIKGILKIK